MLTRNLQINHADISTAISPFNPNFTTLLPGAAKSLLTMAQVDAIVTVQALMISYINDFKLMMIITLCAMPLALLLKKPDMSPLPPGQAPIAHD